MSRETIIDYVAVEVESMVTTARVEKGIPAPFPHTDIPLIYLTVEHGTQDDMTFGGASRLMEVRWRININVVLGPPDMPRNKAEQAAYPYASRARAALSNDHTLGGLVRDSNLLLATDNFNTYRETNQPATLTIPFEIIEEVAANAAGD